MDAIEQGLELLGQHPEAAAPCGAIAPGLEGLRRWPVPAFSGHLIFYRPREDGIEVVRVLHGAQDLERLLASEERAS